MSYKDMKQIAVWALTTAIVVGGLVTGGAAVSNDPLPTQPQLSATIEGVNFVAVAKPGSDPDKVEVTIKADNPSTQPKKVNVDVAVVRKDFVGNALSRTPTSIDFKETTELGKLIQFKPAGNDTTIRTLTVPVSAKPASGKDGMPGAISSYEVQVKTGNKAPTTILTFPANLASNRQ